MFENKFKILIFKILLIYTRIEEIYLVKHSNNSYKAKNSIIFIILLIVLL